MVQLTRREFLQALAAAGVTAAIGVDLVPRYLAADIEPLIEVSKNYSLEHAAWELRAQMTTQTGRVLCASGRFGQDVPTEAERQAFRHDAALAIADFVNNGAVA